MDLCLIVHWKLGMSLNVVLSKLLIIIIMKMIFIEYCKELIMRVNGIRLNRSWKRIVKNLIRINFLLLILYKVILYS